MIKKNGHMPKLQTFWKKIEVSDCISKSLSQLNLWCPSPFIFSTLVIWPQHNIRRPQRAWARPGREGSTASLSHVCWYRRRLSKTYKLCSKQTQPGCVTAQLIEALDPFFNTYFYTANRYKRGAQCCSLGCLSRTVALIFTHAGPAWCQTGLRTISVHKTCAQDLRTRPAH